jgi:hypothetical protein
MFTAAAAERIGRSSSRGTTGLTDFNFKTDWHLLGTRLEISEMVNGGGLSLLSSSSSPLSDHVLQDTYCGATIMRVQVASTYSDWASSCRNLVLEPRCLPLQEATPSHEAHIVWLYKIIPAT